MKPYITHVRIFLKDGTEDIIHVQSLSLSKRVKGFGNKEYDYRYHNTATDTGGFLNQEQYLHLADLLNTVSIPS